MAFLAQLAALLLEFFFGKLYSYISDKKAQYLEQKKIKDEAKSSMKALNDAKTEKEADDAAKDALDKF